MVGEAEDEAEIGLGATVADACANDEEDDEEEEETVGGGDADAGWLLLVAAAAVEGASFFSLVPLPNFLVSFLNIASSHSAQHDQRTHAQQAGRQAGRQAGSDGVLQTDRQRRV